MGLNAHSRVPESGRGPVAPLSCEIRWRPNLHSGYSCPIDGTAGPVVCIDVDPTEVERMVDTTLKISGMTCGGCVKSVTRVLERVDGVEAVSVSLEGGIATVKSGEGIHAEGLIEAVEKAGFGATVGR